MAQHDWFAPNTMLASRWLNMTPTSTYIIFSIDKYLRTPRAQKIFMINTVYDGCQNDSGYLAVIEKGDCKCDKHVLTLPLLNCVR